MPSGRSSPVQQATTDNGDPIPHGLPIRFTNLSVPVPSSQQAGSEQLVATLASSLWDVTSLGPVRRFVQRVVLKHEHGPKLHHQPKVKYQLKAIDGIVEQVSFKTRYLSDEEIKARIRAYYLVSRYTAASFAVRLQPSLSSRDDLASSMRATRISDLSIQLSQAVRSSHL